MTEICVFCRYFNKMEEKEGDISQGLQSLKLNGFDMEIIQKPRTTFSSNALRRAIPKMNIKEKINSISMNKLNVLSALRLGGSNSNIGSEKFKKVLTVSHLPKM